MDAELPLADELAAVFARLSGLLPSPDSIEWVTALAAEVNPGTDGAGLTVFDGNGLPATVVATTPLVSAADDLQYALEEGPCLTAWRERTVVRVDDATREARWPKWATAAADAGVRSVVSAPLPSGAGGRGVLKVYARRPAAYGDRDEELLTTFATRAAALTADGGAAAARVSDELKTTMRARDVVNMAKGVLMERQGIDERTAFLLLTTMARDQHHTVHEQAVGLTAGTSRRLR